jgi:(2Fe-2S) ferredoxin
VTHESERLHALLEREISASDDLRPRVCVVAYTCFGRCDDGPNMFVQELAAGEDPTDEPDVAVFESGRGFYPGMDEAKIVRVLHQHCGAGTVVEDLVDSY